MNLNDGGQSQSGSGTNNPGDTSSGGHFSWSLSGDHTVHPASTSTSASSSVRPSSATSGPAQASAVHDGGTSATQPSVSTQPLNEQSRQTAASIARKKVLEAYARSSQASTSQSATSGSPSAAGQSTMQMNPSHLKDAAPRINSESWKRYHTAWQNYYQKYYSDYYSKAARTYIETEKLKQARAQAEEDDILESITRSSRLGRKSGQMSLNPHDDTTGDDIRAKIRRKIQKSAVKDVKKIRRHRRIIPILAGVLVALFILFMQYNRLIFAPIMAYVSPGNTPATEIEAVDPTITQEVSAEPRLIIPKLNVDVPIRFGVAISDVMAAMNNGVAHYRIPGASAFPGEVGNTVITGHSAGDVYSANPYKYIFSGLERLEDGDLIYVNYNSVRYTYQVYKKEIVLPTNVAALVVQTDQPLLTLVTCTPLGTSEKRLLIFAKQISPATDNAKASTDTTIVVDENQDSSLPSNEPTFFEGIWKWLTGA